MEGLNDSRAARLRLPQWLWGGKPDGFVAAAQLKSRRSGDTYSVRTMESYLQRSRPGFVDSAMILDADFKPGPGYHLVAAVADEGIDGPIRRKLSAKFDVTARPDPTGLPGLVDRIQQDLSLCPGAGLPGACEAALRELQTLRFDGDGGQVFPNANVHLIRRDKAILHRLKLASVLLRLERDERLAAGDARHLLTEGEGGRTAFASSSALSDGFLLLDAYIEPVLASLSPAVWGFAVNRVGGTIVFSYGRPLSGTAPQPGELLRTFHAVSPRSGSDSRGSYTPFAHAEAAASALAWWTLRIDELFGVLTDPVVFANGAGEYSPTSNLQAVLSVEQVFRRTNSLLLSYHDAHARRALAFTVLDTLRSLTAVNLERMFDYDVAVKTLRNLQSMIPPESQDVLLPAAHRAVEALRAVQDGFFLREANGRVRLADQTVTLARASAEYLGMLRDATHGFTTTRATSRQRATVASLLALHDGNVPHDIGLIAWLYLLDVLVRPERLRKVLSDQTRRG